MYKRQPHTSVLVLKGKYSLTAPKENVSLENKGNETVVKVTTKYAMPVEFELCLLYTSWQI